MQHLFWNISCNIELQNSGRVNFYPSACQQEIVICLHLKLHSSAIWYVTDLTFTCYCMTANCCNQSFHIQKWLLVMSNLEITRSWRNFENKKYSSEPTTCSYEIIGKTKHLEPWSFPMSSTWRSEDPLPCICRCSFSRKLALAARLCLHILPAEFALFLVMLVQTE